MGKVTIFRACRGCIHTVTILYPPGRGAEAEVQARALLKRCTNIVLIESDNIDQIVFEVDDTYYPEYAYQQYIAHVSRFRKCGGGDGWSA